MHRKIFALKLMFRRSGFLHKKSFLSCIFFSARTIFGHFWVIDRVYIIHFWDFWFTERFCAHWALKLEVV